MYVLTNGVHYITQEGNGIKSCGTLENALRFETPDDAMKVRERAPGKTRKFKLIDLDTNEVVAETGLPKPKKTKQKRKHYSDDVRKLVYIKANGTCQLCGRKIALEDMTLDHIVPLAMNGKDDVENLQCTCLACNQFKGSILPDEFNARISEIFMYQMKKRNGNRLRWKLAYRLMSELNEN